MYSAFQLARKYGWYYLTAQSGKGHGIHSPFVFDFIIHVLKDQKEYNCYPVIEALRRRLLKEDKIIEVEDFGAGSAVIPFRKRKVRDIARSSLKNRKYGQLLFRIGQYYQARLITELGTSFGITSCYLAAAGDQTHVITFEGSNSIAQIARENFKSSKGDNIELVQGNFEQTLPLYRDKMKGSDLVFIDGNHRKKATLDYFNSFIPMSGSLSVIILDDIHWSPEMEEAWKVIREHDCVKLTIDLFFMGLVFFSSDFKVKQHFTIRF